MRQAHHLTIDRTLLLYLLQLAEPHGLMSDVKLQQLAFLCALQMFDKNVRGFSFEFYRFAYGAFSIDLDNDLLSLRKKERLENFSPSDKAEDAIALLLTASTGVDHNEQVLDILRAVTATYAPQDSGMITQSVEAVELSTADNPFFKLAIRDISFHTTILVPSRIEVKGALTLSPSVLAKLNAALGYT